MVGAAQPDHDGLADRPDRQPEHQRHRRLGPPDGPAGRRPGGPRQHGEPPDQLLGAAATAPARSWSEVDVVSGVGYARAEAAGPSAMRFHEIRRVVSNLGVFDFETPDRTMRVRSVHPGVALEEVVAATGFELVVPPAVPETRSPTPEELDLIRTVLDPGAEPRPRGRAVNMPGAGPTGQAERPGRRGARAHPALRTRLLRAGRRPVPDRADRDGLGGRSAAGGGHRRGGRARDPGLGHHDRRRAGGPPSPRSGPGPTGPSASTCGPTRPTWASGWRS